MKDEAWYQDFSFPDVLAAKFQGQHKAAALFALSRLPSTPEIKAIEHKIKTTPHAGTAALSMLNAMGHPDFRISHDGFECASHPVVNSLHEYVWIRTGRPRWFVDSSMAEILSRTDIDDDLTNIRWPHDVFHLVFERGTTLRGIPLRWIQVGALQSSVSLSLMAEMMGVKCAPPAGVMDDMMRRKKDLTLLVRVDAGENFDTGKCSGDTPPLDTKTWDIGRPLSGFVADGIKGLNDHEKEVVFEATKIAVASVLYWNARPEFVRDFTLPRSCRYNWKHRDNIRRVYLPVEKVIRPAPSALPGESGRTMPPHFRGYVLRTLRAERFKRNPDGTFRVIYVPPCAIHPELMEETTPANTGELAKAVVTK